MKIHQFSHVGVFFTIVFLLAIIFPLRGTDAALTFDTVNTAKVLRAPLLPLAENRSVSLTINPGVPVRVMIPAISLDSKVLSLGQEKNGEMSVPSGKSNDVGWYKYGTLPGNVGSAVFDAHVFAAFADLNKLKPGDDIFVFTNLNQKLRFVVGETKTYKLGSLSSKTLFGQTDAKRLNLITCAGSLTKDRSTYTHRHVVFATFADALIS